MSPPRLNLVLIGPPGSGKGTQAIRLAERYRVPHISTGDILRAAVKEGSPLGRQVSDTLASGGLVGDGLMTELVRERLARRDVDRGFILDGFPRTAVQAETLDAMFSGQPLLVVLIHVADEEIVRRLGLRRVCASCAITQSVSGPAPGQHEGEVHGDPCPYCGGPLVVRQDDNPETVRTRLRTYAAYAAPVIDYFESHREVATVDGLQTPDAVTTALRSCIDAFARRAPGVG